MRSTVALLLLIAVGCARVPDVAPRPRPDDGETAASATISTFSRSVDSALRKVYLETADKLDAGEIKTIEAMIANESGRFDDAFDEAAQALADREKRETQPGWTPEKAAAYRRKIAGEP